MIYDIYSFVPAPAGAGRIFSGKEAICEAEEKICEKKDDGSLSGTRKRKKERKTFPDRTGETETAENHFKAGSGNERSGFCLCFISR